MKRRANVLVVDDEKTVCNSCRKILTQEGYKVDFAFSGAEAIKKVKGDGFDVVITDWKMPEMDGLEVARRIKKEKPNVVVIMITGYPSLESSIEAIRSGISDYVPKPFTPEELSDVMIRALAKGQAVPTELVLDRLVEKGVVTPIAKPEVMETPQVAPTVTPKPFAEEKVGPVGFALKSILAPVFSRLFFVFLGPLVIFTIFAGLFKAAFGKKPLG
ncbi:MAG: response regulator [Candidatus Zixiibacteriota bacterium]